LHGKLEIKQAVEMTVGILNGLEFLHLRNIIHRDLKPANILLQGTTPRLADFGISRAMKTTMASQSQHISGTFAYMSPEALDGRRSVQTDIWSVGVNLYQFLTGSLPFPQKEFTQLLTAIAGGEPEPLPDFVPPELKRIIAKSLAKLPENRYKTADEMREDLRRFLQGNSEQTLKIPSYQVPPTEASPNFGKTVTDKTDSVVTNVKVPSETETTIHPVSSQAKSKKNLLYFAVPAVAMLLFAIIGGSYWLISGKPNQATNTSPIATPSPTANITLIPFRKGDKWGFSDENKKIIIEPKYDDVEQFSNDRALVALKDLYGFIDKTGKEIIEIKYKSYDPLMMFLPSLSGYTSKFNNGVSFVAIDKGNDSVTFVLIDKSGKEISRRYDYIDEFSNELARVELNAKWGFINTSGKEIIQLKYEEAGNFKDGIAPVVLEVDGKKNGGFIDKSGNTVIPFNFGGLLSYGDGLICTRRDNKWIFIDKNYADIVIPKLDYDIIDDFSEGLASVRLKRSFGFIDKTGNEIVPLLYEKVEAFN
jgi:serine/threonine protein kinase